MAAAATIVEALSAAVGGAVGRATSFPIDSLKVKISCNTDDDKPSVPDLIRKNGVLGLYNGVHISVLEATTSRFITFGLYNMLKTKWENTFGDEPNMFFSMILAYFADLVCVPAASPLELKVSNRQVGNKKGTEQTLPYGTMVKRSFVASLFLSLKPALELTFYEALKKFYIRKFDNLSALGALGLGALARAGATLLIYPILRIKLREMTGKSGKDAEGKFPLAEYVRILKEEGIQSLYSGLSMELCRGITQSAVMFMVKEKMEQIIIQFAMKIMLARARAAKKRRH